ncbi:antitoxin Xre/MbcA/ParS toxin-binding domain-containing protein [Sulfitobacter sp. 1A13368]|uniref:antitoxin Xre/MbcA/ParS toxin-binding domain-containing protein n=1 Tax=Sulfitobacter sp. 1A13368 TaxID=3368593 RepID=UPI0037452738
MTETELMELCTKVMGSPELAEEWMSSTAMALDNRRPADLMETQSGRDEVEILLMQIEHGVYI